MIIKQYIEDGKFIKYFSNADFKIQKEGTEEIYDDAVELHSTDVTYIETGIPIGSDAPPDEATVTDYQKALQNLGVDINE